MGRPEAEPAWWVVVPVKGAPAGKSRLAGAHPDRRSLSRAIALDTIAAAAAAVTPRCVVVVTNDPDVDDECRDGGMCVVADSGAGLNAAIRAGRDAVARLALVAAPSIAALLGDLPALRSADLVTALDAAAPYERAFVPDREGSGTVLLTARGVILEPAFGVGSATRHARSGAVRLDVALPRLRTDVDVPEDLAEVLRMGCGPHTTAVVARAGPRHHG